MTCLMRIIRHACVYGTRVRLATLEMAILLIKQLAVVPAYVHPSSVDSAPSAASPNRQPNPITHASQTAPVGSPSASDSASSTGASSSKVHNSAGGVAGTRSDRPSQPLSCLRDAHLSLVKCARDESALLLKGFLKSDEIFLDMFEEEYEQGLKALNVEYLMMDGNLLLPPIGTPMSGLDFHKRLPCGEIERAIRAIRAFFLIRHLCLVLRGEVETELPLTKESDLVRVGQVLDLTNNDLVACTVYNTKNDSKLKRFMVIDSAQVILVEPEASRLGFGVVRLAGMLQDIEVTGDQNDSRALHITIHRASNGPGGRPGGSTGTTNSSRAFVHSPPKRPPLLAAKFIFDDHIRCMAAKQKLTKGRLRARQKKMQQIAKLLDMNISSTSPTPGLPIALLGGSGSAADSGGHRLLSRSGSTSTSSDSSHLHGSGLSNGARVVRSSAHHSPLITEYAFYDAQRVFGYDKRGQYRHNHCQQLRQQQRQYHEDPLKELPSHDDRLRRTPRTAVPAFNTSSRASGDRRRVASLPVDIKDTRRKHRSVSRSRESSPRTLPQDEEIPLEDLSGHSSPRFSRNDSPLCSPTRQFHQQLHKRTGSLGNGGCNAQINGVTGQTSHCDNANRISLANGEVTGGMSDQFTQDQHQQGTHRRKVPSVAVFRPPREFGIFVRHPSIT
ncbi:protein CLEC16A-like [Tropilaelaps mercedesae]|uniref:Protein CLEC16A-like n=1 Tax=Tropilaelaps mercedesae TaxID=418985 RepID=A0A1V9XAH9_9ACAR|nr:protein CLEC16A-like [Tropilaelaps mercedesae]